jgi:DNA-binding NtrC family response regulator
MVALSGPDRGRELVLESGTYRVGKDPRCALVLQDGAVSRQHLELEVRADGVVARDLGSKNGSYKDGSRFRELTVAAGTTVTIGATELRFAVAELPSPILPSQALSFGRLHGGSLAMREVYARLEPAALSTSTVLIQGETGTGKELCAESLHQRGARRDRPFVVVDLGAIARSLLDSELFGHVRGAFTGAERDREGAFAVADGGTIFLDEVGELPLEVQSHLLRVLSEHQVRPLGKNQFRKVDVRVIAATNRDLAAECKAGRFRPDLYHRLAVIEVTLPPLRLRKEDLPLLVELFVRRFSSREVTVSPIALALLSAYHWPGNVRELGNLVERALSLLGHGRVITPELLAPDLALPAAAPSDGDFHAAKEQLVASWERAYLIELLARAQGSVTRAAALGGIHRPYLHRLLKKHALGPGRP